MIVITPLLLDEDSGKGRSASKPSPIVLITPGMKYVDQLRKDTERKGLAAEWEKTELARAEELEQVKKDFDTFVKNATDLDMLMAIQESCDECRRANSRYMKARSAIALCKAKKGHISGGDVSKAISAFSEVQQQITARAAKVKNDRIYLSNKDRIEENTKRLAFVLNQSGLGCQINLDSCGLNRNKQGEFRLLVWNGYLHYEPGDCKAKTAAFLKDLDFVQQKTPEYDLEIFLLENNDKKGVSFWGQKKNFNWHKLQFACGLKDEYNRYQGVYASVTPGRSHTSYRIPCNRLTLAANRTEHCHVIVVDLRPQGWSPWSLYYTIDESDLRHIATPDLQITLSQPEVTHCYGTANLLYRHLPIERKAKCNIIQNVAVNGKITNTVNPGVTELMFQNSAPKTAEDWIFDGKTSFGERNYEKAFSCFSQAAALGSELGALSCGALLLEYPAKILDRKQTKTAFVRAERYLRIAQQSKDVTIRANANYLLGCLYQNGGHGITRNSNKAKECFQAAAQEGNQDAAKNLKLQEKHMRRK